MSTQKRDPTKIEPKKRGRPTLFDEKLTLANFRIPKPLLEELHEAAAALGKRGASDLVRDALREHLDRHSRAIGAYRRSRARHGDR